MRSGRGLTGRLRQRRGLDRDDARRAGEVLALRVLDLRDLVGEGGDPRVRQGLRVPRVARPRGDLDQHGVRGLLDADPPDERRRVVGEAELLLDVLRGRPARRDVDVRRGPRLGELVLDRPEGRVVGGARC